MSKISILMVVLTKESIWMWNMKWKYFVIKRYYFSFVFFKVIIRVNFQIRILNASQTDIVLISSSLLGFLKKILEIWIKYQPQIKTTRSYLHFLENHGCQYFIRQYIKIGYFHKLQNLDFFFPRFKYPQNI